jgi:DNA-binding GntR family transcriptional regulator
MRPGGTSVGSKTTVAEDVYRALRHDILTLRHRPGAPLRELDLAERHGASRVPVREALGRLQQEGLVESVPYKGYFAGQLSLREIGESFDLRLVLESHSVRQAVTRARDEDHELLRRLAQTEYTHQDWNSYGSFLEQNLAYHVALAGVSGNRRLVRVVSDLIESMQRYFYLGLDLGDFGREMRAEHEVLNAEIERGDPDRAVECVRVQILASRSRILKALLSERPDLPVE